MSDQLEEWRRCVSDSNWQKGEIINDWLAHNIGKDAEDFAGEVGGITAEHVRRLRRTSSRFGDDHHQYPNLLWGHFYAALDWQDAHAWLTIANLGKLEVSEMRFRRWNTESESK